MIEVLASMAILLILMLALMRMFEEATAAFKKGTTSVTRSAAARAVMDMITRDLEGAVIDRRFQFYKEANTVYDNFDEMYFVTMAGDPNDGRSYQLVHYYVDVETNTYAGAKYRSFRLMRGAITLTQMRGSSGIDVLSITKPFGWWGKAPSGDWSPKRIADNIVRFDLYVHDENGRLLGGQNGWIPRSGTTRQEAFDTGGISKASKAPGYSSESSFPSNTPPAFIDVYLQVASEDAMKRGGLDLIAADIASQPSLRQEGISILYRESFLLVSRIHPTMASAQVAHPSTY